MTQLAHGDVLTSISDGIVGLIKQYYGRGPRRAKTYYEDDIVVCLLRGGYTRVEQTLLDGGRGESVIAQRMEFQEVMRERFSDVIEQATGQRVIAFMSGNQQEPDIMCEVFVLAPNDLIDSDEDDLRAAVLGGLVDEDGLTEQEQRERDAERCRRTAAAVLRHRARRALRRKASARAVGCTPSCS